MSKSNTAIPNGRKQGGGRVPAPFAPLAQTPPTTAGMFGRKPKTGHQPTFKDGGAMRAGMPGQPGSVLDGRS